MGICFNPRTLNRLINIVIAGVLINRVNGRTIRRWIKMATLKVKKKQTFTIFPFRSYLGHQARNDHLDKVHWSWLELIRYYYLICMVSNATGNFHNNNIFSRFYRCSIIVVSDKRLTGNNWWNALDYTDSIERKKALTTLSSAFQSCVKPWHTFRFCPSGLDQAGGPARHGGTVALL